MDGYFELPVQERGLFHDVSKKALRFAPGLFVVAEGGLLSDPQKEALTKKKPCSADALLRAFLFPSLQKTSFLRS
jgi:hypothetical protein